MKIEVEGSRELVKSLRRVDKELLRELTILHRELVEPLVPRAQSRAPTQSGALAGSIRAQSGQKYGRIAAGGARVPYAGPIHFGWPARNIEPQAFLTDVIDESGEELVDRYQELLERFINRVWETI